jgi:hypothetical protein
MKNLFIFSPVLVCVLFKFSSVANAQNRSEEIEELKRQIEEIKRQQDEQINQLRKRIEELEAQGPPQPTETQDTIVGQGTESKDAWYKNIRAGYDKGFFAETADENFKIKMNILGQFQFSIDESENMDTSTNFEIRRFRLKWEGNAFRRWYLYTLQIGDDGNGFELVDAYFTAGFRTKYGEVITPRAGQFKVPFTREKITPAQSLQLVDRSIINSEFGIDRERGPALYGVLVNTSHTEVEYLTEHGETEVAMIQICSMLVEFSLHPAAENWCTAAIVNSPQGAHTAIYPRILTRDTNLLLQLHMPCGASQV